MAMIKCKMCGGDLNVTEGMTVAECEYCGTRQTVPNVDNEKKLTLFSRANRLRLACEFDKAAGVYENIVAEFTEEAEAYWGLVLCRYGIEYVDDPATGKKVPTCHRSSYESVLEDENLEKVMEYADAVARRVYREDAQTARLGDAEIDWGKSAVHRNGVETALTAKEFTLLRKLWDARGNIVTIDALCAALWDGPLVGYENTLMVHIRRLREKIEADPSHPNYLLTVRGLGYRLSREGTK